MTTYLEKIQLDLKDAMKKRDAVRTRTLRMLLSKLKEKRIEVLHDLKEEEELTVIRKAAKERQDSARTYQEAGRTDLAEKEEEELKIIETYLPAEMDDEAIRQIVRKIIRKSGAESIRDLGKVMGPAMKELTGRADGKRVQIIVREELGG
ncbi:MAG: GatB/YqeY domain-containing protein [Candidatus Neomarinimicrobiota bacterium]|nr:GatB/YqeY domain-containing protein [Candidatus Neomarinimicrobiota bacterium]RKY50321.1 MAG: GatB/YqeY domain-containing protein [Candidatus Neomarinimicrobiota bacterium]